MARISAKVITAWRRRSSRRRDTQRAQPAVQSRRKIRRRQSLRRHCQMLSAQGGGPSPRRERASRLAVTTAEQIFSVARMPVKRRRRLISGSLELTPRQPPTNAASIGFLRIQWTRENSLYHPADSDILLSLSRPQDSADLIVNTASWRCPEGFFMLTKIPSRQHGETSEMEHGLFAQLLIVP